MLMDFEQDIFNDACRGLVSYVLVVVYGTHVAYRYEYCTHNVQYCTVGLHTGSHISDIDSLDSIHSFIR
jgi:hypothetical protein